MDFLKVVVPGKECQDIDVLINEHKNGKATEVLTLNRGFVLISVDIPDAEEKPVDLCNTTVSRPRIEKIKA